MHTKTQALLTKHKSNRSKRKSNISPKESNTDKLQSNPRFVRGLAELLGQFSPTDLEAHRPALILLINDILASIADSGGRSDTNFGPLGPDTATVVVQRVASHLATSSSS